MRQVTTETTTEEKAEEYADSEKKQEPHTGMWAAVPQGIFYAKPTDETLRCLRVYPAPFELESPRKTSFFGCRAKDRPKPMGF